MTLMRCRCRRRPLQLSGQWCAHHPGHRSTPQGVCRRSSRSLRRAHLRPLLFLALSPLSLSPARLRPFTLNDRLPRLLWLLVRLRPLRWSVRRLRLLWQLARRRPSWFPRLQLRRRSSPARLRRLLVHSLQVSAHLPLVRGPLPRRRLRRRFPQPLPSVRTLYAPSLNVRGKLGPAMRPLPLGLTTRRSRIARRWFRLFQAAPCRAPSMPRTHPFFRHRYRTPSDQHRKARSGDSPRFRPSRRLSRSQW